jgi:glycosyltransferase involved in cell wall biosynthesis
MKQLSITLIIPVKNRYLDLRNCLNSILNLNYVPSKIIIVDDGSSNKEFIKIKKLCISYPVIDLIKNKTTKGVSYCKNLGLKKVKTDFVWFVDSDTIIVNKDCLKVAVSFLKKNPCSVVGGEIVIDKFNFKYIRETKLLPNKWSFFLHHRLPLKKDHKMIETSMIPTSNFFTKKSVLNNVSFSNNIFTAEDKLICLLLKKKQIKFFILPSISLVHKYARSGRVNQNNLLANHFNSHAFIYGAINNKSFGLDYIFLSMISFPLYLISQFILYKNFVHTYDKKKISFKLLLNYVFNFNNIRMLFLGKKYKNYYEL